jgi:biopolymer transport protein ExbD
MWPFVTVMFDLLFVVGLAPFFRHSHRIPVDLPVSANAVPEPGASREDAIHIAITQWGDVFFNSAKLSPEDLPAFLKESVRAGAEPKVYLSVDGGAKYADLARVAEQIRRTGIQKVDFLSGEPFKR